MFSQDLDVNYVAEMLDKLQDLGGVVYCYKVLKFFQVIPDGMCRCLFHFECLHGFVALVVNS